MGTSVRNGAKEPSPGSINFLDVNLTDGTIVRVFENGVATELNSTRGQFIRIEPSGIWSYSDSDVHRGLAHPTACLVTSRMLNIAWKILTRWNAREAG